MVDAVVSVFLEKLLGALSDGGRILVEFRDHFEKLQTELQLMQCFLRDAERLKRKNETLRRVMANLRETIYQAEDLLADLQLKSVNDDDDPALTGAWLKCFNPSRIPLQLYAGRRLEDMLAKIAAIKGNISTFLGVQGMGQAEIGPHNDQIPRWSSPVYDHTQVVGLEGDTRKLKGWLREGDVGILAIGVVGMGGLGKTTIAQKVFNERDMEDYFERRIWVSVSQTFTEEQILRSMLRNLGDASVGDSAGELLRKINQYLVGKRFLIVMDDVWDGDDMTWWNKIYEGLPKGNGSSVIITTRFFRVAQRMRVKEERMHYPKCLSKDNSWLLFRKIAFAATGGECNYPELVGVGEEIVEKCKGLPLAIKAVGGIMLWKSPRYPEWRRIVDHFRDELAENDNSVMASLQLSYDELPSYLKSCFLCLSLYPEDCVITKDQLVRWWIGEGFVPLRGGRSATEAGEDCFAGLTNRCLLEVVDKTYYGAIDTCTTHDMVRDLVVKIAKDDAFCDHNDKASKSTRHLSLDAPIARRHFPPNPNLRALLSTTKSGEVNRVPSTVAGKFYDARYLRAIDLSRSIFEAPLSALGALRHLSYVGLSNTHPLVHLPASLERLRSLQVLDVSYCQNLKSLPPFLVAMQRLRVLDASHCGSLEYLPKGLGRLARLEVLLGFKPARPNQSDGCRIGEIRNLMRLRKLGLVLSRADDIFDAELHALVKLQELQQLSINCYDNGGGGELAGRVDKFYPPEQLQELSLRFYPGTVSPTWLNPVSLPMLKYLSVCSGDLRGVSDGFWGVSAASFWGIEGLLLESLSDFEVEWERVREVMPRLRVVCASWCPELVSFPVEDIGFKGGVWKKEDHNNNNNN